MEYEVSSVKCVANLGCRLVFRRRAMLYRFSEFTVLECRVDLPVAFLLSFLAGYAMHFKIFSLLYRSLGMKPIKLEV